MGTGAAAHVIVSRRVELLLERRVVDHQRGGPLLRAPGLARLLDFADEGVQVDQAQGTFHGENVRAALAGEKETA